jgi:hypothetical protein
MVSRGAAVRANEAECTRMADVRSAASMVPVPEARM